MNDIMDMKISGSSAMPGGEYRTVSISGSGKVQGSLRCESLRCSGSARVQGTWTAPGRSGAAAAAVSPATSPARSWAAPAPPGARGQSPANGRVHSSGALKVDGSLEGGEVDVSGGLEAGEIHCGRLHCSGGARVSGGVEAESVHLTGSAVIQGLLNAETVEISASRGIRIGSIGGSSIRIYKPTQVSLLGLFHGSVSCAQVGDIEGDGVDLEYTQADVVRGRRVRIGEGCSIGRVEYSEAWTPGTEPWAKASAPVKVPSDMELLYADKRIAVAVKPPGSSAPASPAACRSCCAQLGTPASGRCTGWTPPPVGSWCLPGPPPLPPSCPARSGSTGSGKIYLAVVLGDPGQGGIWRDMLSRDPVRRVTYIAREPGKDVRPAELSYETLAVRGGGALRCG